MAMAWKTSPIKRRTPGRWLVAALLALAVVAAGCGGSQPAAKPAAPAPAAKAPEAQAKPAAAAPAPAPAAAAQAPAKKGPPVKIRLAQSFPVLDFAPVYLARGLKYFEDENIDLEWALISSGPNTLAALMKGEVQFAAMSGNDPLLAQANNMGDTVAIAGIATSLSMSIAAHQDWVKSKGLSKTSPLEQRVKALKGVDFGVSGPGQAPHLYAAYIMKTFGMDPEKDANFVGVGGGPTRRAALQQKKVVAFMGGMPDAEQTEFDGYGMVYISAVGEVPIFKTFAYETLTVMRDYATKNPEITRSVARAIARANTFLVEKPAESKKILEPFFQEVNPKVISDSVSNNIGSFRKNALMTKEDWDNLAKVLTELGTLKTKVDTAEGKVWTNQYLPK